jgi:putative hemolysin
MSRYFTTTMVALAGFCLLVLASVPARASAEDYCARKGGVVQVRQPFFNTNGGTPLQLAGAAKFCQFTEKKGGSQISVLLSTMMATLPSLAASAYYAEVPYNGSGCKGSPGSCYCSQIGGTDLFGGINASGGGWVLTTDSTDVLDACIFPDLSSIDTYGLFYHSAGIIRGKDLSKVLRYKGQN